MSSRTLLAEGSHATEGDPSLCFGMIDIGKGFAMDMNITITDAASAQMKRLMGDAPAGAVGLRLSIGATGCSGHSYKMEYADEAKSVDGDDLIEDNGARLYIPKMYSWMLIGVRVDYITDELGNSRFDFVNPNETGRCGCGESFQV